MFVHSFNSFCISLLVFILLFVFLNYAVQYYILGQNRQEYPSWSGGMKCSYRKFYPTWLRSHLARGEISPSRASPVSIWTKSWKYMKTLKEAGSQRNRISPVNWAPHGPKGRFPLHHFAAAGEKFWHRNNFFTSMRRRRYLFCRSSRWKFSSSVWPFADGTKGQLNKFFASEKFRQRWRNTRVENGLKRRDLA